MKKHLTIIALTLILTVLPGQYVAFAEDVAPAAPAQAQGPSGPPAAPRAIPCVPSLPCIAADKQASGTRTRDHITQTVGLNAMMVILGISSVASVVMIIYGGLQMHLTMGSDDKVGSAKKIVIYAIAGLIVSTLAAAVVRIVSRIGIQ